MNEILMHDAFNVILWTSADMRRAWNRSEKTRCNRFWKVGCSRL